jgi:hypothetical protein
LEEFTFSLFITWDWGSFNIHQKQKEKLFSKKWKRSWPKETFDTLRRLCLAIYIYKTLIYKLYKPFLTVLNFTKKAEDIKCWRFKTHINH